MRLLFLADAVFEDLPGGSRVVAWELARGLTQRGHEVTFLVARQSPEAPDDERQDGFRIVRYRGAGNAAQFVGQGQKACAKLWAEQPFDLVHTHFAYAALGTLRAVPKSVPRVRTFHGPWDEEGWIEDSRIRHPIGQIKAWVKRRLRWRIEAKNLRGSAKIVTLSDCFARLTHEQYGVKPERVTLIPGGTDLDRFFPPADKQKTRRQLGLPTNRRILFSVRRLAPRMGLDNLIKAMPAIVRRCPDILLLIGGKGPEHTRLEALIQKMGMAAHVRMIGFIADEQLTAYYQAADLFVLPTIALEGFGLVTTEALACGTPVVGTPIGATPEILNGLEPRLIASGADPDSLSSAILGFLEGNWQGALTPTRLHCYIKEHYTWERHIESVENIYKLLCEIK